MVHNYTQNDTETIDKIGDIWTDVKEALPPCNILVAVRLTNGCTSLDFVNEPLNIKAPFQHYLVSQWRYATTEELNKFWEKDNREFHVCL